MWNQLLGPVDLRGGKISYFTLLYFSIIVIAPLHFLQKDEHLEYIEHTAEK